jgi:hypothetical protein
MLDWSRNQALPFRPVQGPEFAAGQPTAQTALFFYAKLS